MEKHVFTGGKLARYRRELGKTQIEMASELGISPSYLNLIEHNRRKLTKPLLKQLEAVYGLSGRSLSGSDELTLVAQLREVFADSRFQVNKVDDDQLTLAVTAAPGLCRQVLDLYRLLLAAQEEVRRLGGRFSENPHIAESNHQLLTLLTTILSFSEILKDNVDLPAERRQRYADVLVEEANKLTSQLNGLFDYLGGAAEKTVRFGASAQADVWELLQRANNHFPELEEAADEFRRETVETGKIGVDALAKQLYWRFRLEVVASDDPRARADILWVDDDSQTVLLSDDCGEPLASFALARLLAQESHGALLARTLVGQANGGESSQPDNEAAPLDADVMQFGTRALSRYFAAAVFMPYDEILEKARDLRYDIQRLQAVFGRTFSQVAYRLTTLQRPGSEGIPFHGLEVDIGGNLLWHFSTSGLQIPRYAPLCPKWNLFEAFLTPGRISVQQGVLPGEQGFLNIACAEADRPGTYGSAPRFRSFMLGCDASLAGNLVYGAGWKGTEGSPAARIGTTCRYCAHRACAHRLAERRN